LFLAERVIISLNFSYESEEDKLLQNYYYTLRTRTNSIEKNFFLSHISDAEDEIIAQLISSKLYS